MPASPARKYQEFQPLPSRPFKLKPGIAEAIADDERFFARFPAVKVRIRRALAAEIAQVQALERRLLDLEPHCEAVALVGQADGRRRRIIIESCAVDFDSLTEATLEQLFADIVAGGWIAIEGGPS